jgi:GxxExxY protein
MEDKEQDRQDKLLHFDLTKTILRCCFEVINTIGVGFVESVYRNSLQIALLENGLKVNSEHCFEVIFHGRKVGQFIPDLIVENAVIVELKVTEHLIKEHQAQLIN